LRLLRWTPEGRHYSGVGGADALAVILGCGWAGSSSFSFFNKRFSSVSGWIGATAIICMFLSGWAIYNASPSLPFTFPRGLTLGGWRRPPGLPWRCRR
jgi:thiosulfate reductase cytochrome b subunit